MSKEQPVPNIPTDNTGENTEEKMGRRKFFEKILGIAAGVATGMSFPKIGEAKAGLKIVVNNPPPPPKKPKIEQPPPEVDISDQVIAKAEEDLADVKFKPEYEQRLKRLLLTIPEGKGEYFIREAYEELFSKLPKDTIIYMVLVKNDADRIKEIIAKLGVQHDIRYKTIDSGHIEKWARDYCKIVSDENGKAKLVLPEIISSRNGKVGPHEAKRSEDRHKAMVNAFGNENVIKAKFVFEGGNILFDDGVVFVGYNDIQLSKDNRGTGEELSDKEIALEISKQFGGAKVAVMGNKEQHPPFVHIDQSFIPLGNKTMVMNVMTGEGHDPVIRQQHLYYKKQLESLGYKIITIENSANDVKNCYSSVNAIPFTDSNGKKKIIFPVFPGEMDDKGGLQGKALAAYKAFQEAGYELIPVKDKILHQEYGNIHCLINVLAQLGEKTSEEFLAFLAGENSKRSSIGESIDKELTA